MGYQRRVHGGNTSAHMMGRLLVLVALIALSAAVPTKTDVVVPETKFDHRVAFSQMSPTDFIQAMSKAGNSETQCREFATDTIADITATVTGSCRCSSHGSNRTQHQAEHMHGCCRFAFSEPRRAPGDYVLRLHHCCVLHSCQ